MQFDGFAKRKCNLEHLKINTNISVQSLLKIKRFMFLINAFTPIKKRSNQD